MPSNRVDATDPADSSLALFGHLVRALSQAETVDEVAQVIAEAGAAAAGASYANIALLDLDRGAAKAHIYHASNLIEDVAGKYSSIALDENTSLGSVLRSGREVWLPSLAEIAKRYPALHRDTVRSGLAATASLALFGRYQRVIGAMGVAWDAPQTFSEAQQERVRVVAQLAGDALGRALLLEGERAVRLRSERLQRTLTALVASASLAEVIAVVFQHGLPPFGASAAQLELIDPQRPQFLVGLDAVGLPAAVAQRWQALPASVPTPARQAVVTGETVYLPTPADLAAGFPEVHQVLGDCGHRAWLALPLRSGGRMLGVLTLMFPQEHPLVDGSDQIALTALGSAVADALSRAIQHDSDHDVVVTVQRSLLPHTLPERFGTRLGVTYLPAEARYGIGGDWYDAVPLSRGRLLLMVGDVAGHGLQAAITMGQMRSAARALAPAHSPAALLEALDQFSTSTFEDSVATAAVVVIDPAQKTLRYSLAGHPPPLLRAPDGTVTSLEAATGALLGLEIDHRPEQVVSYAPGSALVLYTDGLVERHDESVDAGLARLAAALAHATATDPETLCGVLVEDAGPRRDPSDNGRSGGGRHDDVAVLCAQLTA